MNINGNIKKTAPKLALFMSALIWGSSFIVMKSTVDAIPIFTLLAIRFTAAFVILRLVFIKRLKKIRLDDIWKGAVIGFCLFAAYVTQTIGITDTTPGKNAFLTAIYCVIVPFLFWLVNKTKPDKFNICLLYTSSLCLRPDRRSRHKMEFCQLL